MSAQIFVLSAHSFGKFRLSREWYNVNLDTALEVACHIADGTIVEYRMDNTTKGSRRLNNS